MVKKPPVSRRTFLLLIMVLPLISFILAGAQATGIALRDAGTHASVIDDTDFCTTEDLDNDGNDEDYLLKNHILTVTEGGKTLYQSPHDYRVDSFALGDINNDGKSNLVLSLWKKGSYGAMKPFWHTGEDESYKNHLFVYRLQDNTFRPVWCSSNLDRPILSFEILDLDEDGRNELVAMEGRYKKIAGENYTADPAAPKLQTVWQWEEWGFQRIDLTP